MLNVFFSLLLLLFVLILWNTFSIRAILKKTNQNFIADEKYFELKYKLEFITAGFAVTTLIAGYFGYNFDTSAKQSKIAMDVLEQRIKKDSIQINENIFLITKSRDENVRALTNQWEAIKKLNQELKVKSKIIDSIYKVSMKELKVNITYHIDNVIYKIPTGEFVPEHHEFAEFITTDGQKLPIFKKPPYVNVISSEGQPFRVSNITITGFDLIVQDGFYEPVADVFHLSVIVTDHQIGVD
ncbi:MAG TPA: hypothetical protein VK154_06660 [Chitinophagales bacterium]|nr:hypothetical protein [Chitinophagales bacterium]